MASTVYQKTLHRAAEILGGKQSLGMLLHVPLHRLEAWLDGTQEPPLDVFLKAVDVVSGEPLRRSDRPVANAVQRSRDLRRRAGELRDASVRTVERAVQIRDSLIVVRNALEAALSATGTRMGNAQLLYPEGLHIVAQRGFRRPFLDFFQVVRLDDGCACGAALKTGSRIIIPDVENDPIFRGTPAGEILADAGVRAVQSTPVMVDGQVAGIISTHYAEHGVPGERDLEQVDEIVRRTASSLTVAAAGRPTAP